VALKIINYFIFYIAYSIINNNIYTSFTAPSFMFGKPNRIQRPWKRSYATTAEIN